MIDIVKRLGDLKLNEDSFAIPLRYEAKAEIERLRALTEWKVIKTAPNHVSVLLGRVDSENSVYEGVVYQLKFSNSWSYTTSPTGETPTHWMPKPEPPKECPKCGGEGEYVDEGFTSICQVCKPKGERV